MFAAVTVMVLFAVPLDEVAILWLVIDIVPVGAIANAVSPDVKNRPTNKTSPENERVILFMIFAKLNDNGSVFRIRMGTHFDTVLLFGCYHY